MISRLCLSFTIYCIALAHHGKFVESVSILYIKGLFDIISMDHAAELHS